MKNRNYKNSVISKVTALLLVLAISISPLLPSAALTSYAATGDTKGAAAEKATSAAVDNTNDDGNTANDAENADSSANTSADSQADVLATSQSDANGSSAADPADAEVSEADKATPDEPAETTITNYKTTRNKNINKAMIIVADITPGYSREIQLQRYNSTNDTWDTISTVHTLAKPESSADPESDENAEADSEDADGSVLPSDSENADNSLTNTDSSDVIETTKASSNDPESNSDANADDENESNVYEDSSSTIDESELNEPALDTSADTEESGENSGSSTDVNAEAEPSTGEDAYSESMPETVGKIIDAENGVVQVKISIPKEERMKTSSVWRLFVPAGEKSTEACSDNINLTTRNIESLSMSANAACIYRIDSDGSGTLIYSRNGRTRLAQASTTKLMTATLLLESGLIDSKTKITAHAAATPWGSGHLSTGDVYSTRDLLYAMLLPSSNDAATAVAEKVGGTEGKFVNMMNAKAQKMGWTDTHFCNPHGLDADGHYTTASELAELTAYAYTFPEIRDCWATQCKTIKSLRYGNSWTLWSTNAIFSYVKEFLGGKTGTETNAGCCFTGVYKHNGRTYVTVVLGSDYGFSRWSDTKKLHNYINTYADTKY